MGSFIQTCEFARKPFRLCVHTSEAIRVYASKGERARWAVLFKRTDGYCYVRTYQCAAFAAYTTLCRNRTAFSVRRLYICINSQNSLWTYICTKSAALAPVFIDFYLYHRLHSFHQNLSANNVVMFSYINYNTNISCCQSNIEK